MTQNDVILSHQLFFIQSSEKFWLGKNTGSAGQNPVFTKNQADF
jgi:hypothetical protein